MTNESHLPDSRLTSERIDRILSPDHPLCREDVVWMLEYIKKKVADGDPALRDLSQPRLLKNFHYFAEASMLLIRRKHYSEQEATRLRNCLIEASYGLK
ncbi:MULTISPECIES: hypothetical protein [unclassified Paenibacillus]|uniref:hypothetical protein n=1 Tax=unclassified Paenibacillus TaxID=185978 RepID=UPI001051C5BE|nr:MULTISPECIES: hypothetical protein [unclassified Paenibacillus]NIK68528.1 hypothetical protein [Paenibacillus sp. BK720]TCM99185.1 hypothetical protein EV294_102472 [Paenibacillus sp. BK033]